MAASEDKLNDLLAKMAEVKPGVVVCGPIEEISEFEVLDRTKAFTPLTVVQNDPTREKVNFTVHIQQGFPIWRDPGGDATPKTEEQWVSFEDDPNNRIVEKDALKSEDKILVQGFFGICQATIEQLDDGSFMGKSASGSTGWFLAYDETDRKCWICHGEANLKALKRLEITR